MLKPDFLQEYPFRRIKPVDGMAVTAELWDEAHEYHRQQQRYHALLAHGSGILAGLEVIASEPPDSTVYVLPGAAIDPAGNLIVLQEPAAYDLGATAEGLLYLCLSYGEGRPVALGPSDQADQPLYVRTDWSLEAGPACPVGALELARVQRTSRTAAVTKANSPDRPGANAIDPRYRSELVRPVRPAAGVAVTYLGGHDCQHGSGMGHLAGSIMQAGGVRLCIDEDVPLTAELAPYTLLYLVGQESFELNRDEMQSLYTYLQGGGTVLMESCRRNQAGIELAADICFLNLVTALGVQMREPPPGHALLTTPYLFAALPVGFETETAPKVLLGDGVIFCGADYGCLWRGERRSGPAARTDIRAALEWGSNIVEYAVRRHDKALARCN